MTDILTGDQIWWAVMAGTAVVSFLLGKFQEKKSWQKYIEEMITRNLEHDRQRRRQKAIEDMRKGIRPKRGER